MPAFMIITAQVHDREAFVNAYAKPLAAADLVAAHGGEYVFRGGGAQLLEGDFGDGSAVLVTRFPDMASLRAFWDSPDYAPLKQAREGLATIQVVAVEGEWQG
jgi:uncharacterized protein (DUF1330 family)